jgi:3-deoxy-manno-octulosonate cytidylyltransferase (CMP-KDO synthetase)
MKLAIIIPARIKSKRFHGKPLKKILGIPMIIRVAQICEKVTSNRNIFIATDAKKIALVVKKNRFNFLMTSPKCLTGTDRVAEAANKIKADIYINVQGDEPLISAQDIKKIIKAKIKNKNHIICGYTKINKNVDPFKRSIPKVVMNEKNELVYISRALVPGSKKALLRTYNKQVCIYAFNKKELDSFKRLKRKSNLEKIEDIEILRFFEFNKKILMIKTNANSIAVDYPEDIKKVEKELLKNDKKTRSKSK